MRNSSAQTAPSGTELPATLVGTAGEWSGKAHLQTKWDWRAVGNFAGGGAGAGLWLAALLVGGDGNAFRLLAFLALAVTALGLLCVMAKMGRPERALNIFRHVETSWMTREGFAMPTLFGCGMGALWQGGVGVMALVATASALFFLYCQARILREARGIPTWSVPAIIPLLLASGLAEGTGLAVLAIFLLGAPSLLPLSVLLLISLVLRYGAWRRYQRDLSTVGVPAESRAVLNKLDGGFVAWGHGLPFLLAAAALGLGEPALGGLSAAAGLLVTLSGWHMKLALITRAGHFYRKGQSLARLVAGRSGAAPR